MRISLLPVRDYLYIGLVGMLLMACSQSSTSQDPQVSTEVPVSRAQVSEAPATDFLIQPAELDIGEVMEGQEAHARLFVRNTGIFPLHIARVESACGCTVSSLGSNEVSPGGFTTLDVSIDTTAKGDSVEKQVSVIDALGRRATATLHLHVRENPHAAAMDGRGIFDGKCAACHYEPAAGRETGAGIYAAVCAMCHGPDGEGAYAPKVKGLDADTVGSILRHGIGRRMPAFARDAGGPLSERQITDLIQWLSGVDEPR